MPGSRVGVIVGTAGGNRWRWAPAVATLAVLPLAIAPFVSDTTRIGHPPVWGPFAGGGTGYRFLLVLGSVLVGLVIGGVAATIWRDGLGSAKRRRPLRWALQLQRARRLAQSEEQPQLATLLEEATGQVRLSIDEIRAVSRGFQPALLAERGLGPAVDALAETSPVPVGIEISPDDLDLGLHPETETTAYFVIAEALTNVAKHARATHASVTVARTGGGLHIRISDNGDGGATPGSGSGLEGLCDRVAAAGGTIDITSDAAGTILEAALPCG